jgi:aminoglycoside phosphotransferase (APT) family kinase protein
MHDDQLSIDTRLVAALVTDQFPHWADLPLRPVESGGTVNALYRLGGELVVRLPLKPEWAPDLDREFAWLPRLGPHLPLTLPEPVGHGAPTQAFPLPWAVYTWIPGHMALPDRMNDTENAARDLAAFLSALQAIDTTGAPGHTYRGLPIQRADPATREAITALPGTYDADLLTTLWDAAQQAPAWSGDPVWVHGDLWHSNLIADDTGRLVGVVDCGGFGVGDPAIDTIPAWSLLDGRSRATFREAIGLDDDTWLRGMGWAINMAVFALPYYADTNPIITANADRMLREVLAEVRRLPVGEP